MKELLKIAKAAQAVEEVKYVDLEGNSLTGLENVIVAINGDVENLNKKE